MDQKKPTSTDREQILVESRKFACDVARLADDRHCRDIVILELAERSPVALFFVIGTGASDQQINAVAREMGKFGEENNFKVYGRAGMQQGRWAVIDFVDVVVHLFDDEYRKFYDLELLWGDAPKVPWQRDTDSE